MNICIVCDDVFPSHGGRGKSTERWALKLAERGHKVIIFSARNKKGIKRNHVGKVEIYRFSALKVPWTKGMLYIGFPYPPNVRTILKREKIDIVIINSQYYLGFLNMLYAKSLNIPVISAIHTQPENITKNLRGTTIIDKAIYQAIINISNSADRVIVPSKFAAKLAKEYELEKNPIVISNGIDIKKFNNRINPAQFKRKYKLKNENIILFVGRLMSEKNVASLLSTMPLVIKQLPNTKLVIVGDGPQKTELKKLAKELKIQKNSIFTGRIKEDLLRQAYAASDIFVLPSIVELQGIVLLEAMACGIPIMAAKTKTSAASELIKEGKNGLTFNPYNKKELAKKILKILTNKQLKDKMSKQSINKVKEHSIEKSIDKLESLCKRLTGKC
ncbi:glycosyltransferase [Candidatus Woesearchaeota archaeon]|nr:glycosyltransferase [Candidatus Woesearchaeota archaeon]